MCLKDSNQRFDGHWDFSFNLASLSPYSQLLRAIFGHPSPFVAPQRAKKNKIKSSIETPQQTCPFSLFQVT